MHNPALIPLVLLAGLGGLLYSIPYIRSKSSEGENVKIGLALIGTVMGFRALRTLFEFFHQESIELLLVYAQPLAFAGVGAVILYTTTKTLTKNQAVSNFSLLAFARAMTDRSFMPRFKTVSIIPGMDSFAPERTATNNGIPSVPPNFFPEAFSSLAIDSSMTWRNSSEMPSSPRSLRSFQRRVSSVVMVYPNGTRSLYFAIFSGKRPFVLRIAEVF